MVKVLAFIKNILYNYNNFSATRYINSLLNLRYSKQGPKPCRIKVKPPLLNMLILNKQQ